MKTTLVFLLAFLMGPATAFADDTESKEEKQRWDANADLLGLKGKWKVAEQNEVAIDPGDNVEFVRNLLIKDIVLKIDGHDFSINSTAFKGKLSNDMNKIEFVPDRWLNTLEPKLRFSFADGTKTEVSYRFSDDALHFRYPANSCSRSGVQITFKRLK